MRQDNLPSPGIYTNSQKLRVEAAKILSHAEITFDLQPEVPAVAPATGTVKSATAEHDALRAFFQACADAVPTTVTTP